MDELRCGREAGLLAERLLRPGLGREGWEDLGKRDTGKVRVRRNTELSAGLDFSNIIAHNSVLWTRENQVQSVWPTLPHE